MGGNQWPKVGVQPIRITEHALQLTEDASKLRKHTLHHQKKTIPWDIIVTFLDSACDLSKKMLEQPTISDLLSEVRDVVRVTKETRTDVKLIKNNIDGGLQAPFKTSGTTATANFKNTMLWAKVAAAASAPPLLVSPPMSSPKLSLSQNTTNVPLTARQLTVKLTDLGVAQGLRTRSNVYILQRIRDALTKCGNVEVVGLTPRVLAAAQLKSGDIRITTSDIETAETLRNYREWVPIFGASATLVVPTFGVMVHGMPTKSMQIEKQEEMIERLTADNAVNIPNMAPTYIGWLTKGTAGKRHSTIVVEFGEAKHANAAIDGGICWDGQILGCQRYDRACRVKQCFRCHKYGHIGNQCQAPHQLCGNCASSHATKECPSKEVKKCAACSGKHSAWDVKCPDRKKELQRVEVAKLTSAKYWPDYTDVALKTPSIASEAPSFTAPLPILTPDGPSRTPPQQDSRMDIDAVPAASAALTPWTAPAVMPTEQSFTGFTTVRTKKAHKARAPFSKDAAFADTTSNPANVFDITLNGTGKRPAPNSPGKLRAPLGIVDASGKVVYSSKKAKKAAEKAVSNHNNGQYSADENEIPGDDSDDDDDDDDVEMTSLSHSASTELGTPSVTRAGRQVRPTEKNRLLSVPQ